MSNTDSFIDEVNDEVRSDRFYASLRRYGWIGIVAVILIVGGAAWNEYNKAQERAKSEALGDGLLAALAIEEGPARAEALTAVPAESPAAGAVAEMMAAAEQHNAGQTGLAVEALDRVATNGDIDPIYRQIAAFKSLTLQVDRVPADTLRPQFEALAAPGQPLSLLAQEQLALLDIREGNTSEAIDRYQAVLQDAAVTADLQQRALQVIVSLGGTPDMENLPTAGN
ncbi:hypothetical protein [uncultured Roseobacter sp.]|uniref:hypothetical protein n=1 Tax=uncultured Roseobacter sp. TaxID=114847 RepID=UPI002602B689|nr:hypothetical protein [uncultured Roseobacter sp.]